MAELALAAKVYSGIRGGNEAKKRGDIDARELRKRASARRAAGHREAEEEQRNAELAYSRALAIAAASGGGVSDPGVVKIFADLQAEGDFRVLSRLYAGEDEAQGIEYRADVAQREGRARRKLSRYGALSEAVSFADRYA
ncbi:hypothetical protein LCGC14_2727060 [marine sediment metagenome]|uniref:Uncharacterized protein n=1 Tax=marine sediment metagenome TaxID=412755 RepID=A0A0F9C039_9ZZZZ